MSTYMGKDKRHYGIPPLLSAMIAICASVMTFASPALGDVAGPDERTSISLHVIRGGRDNPVETRETTEDHDALVTEGSRVEKSTRGALSKSGIAVAGTQSASFDFWFYEADVILYNDDDNDGFFHGIDLLFDVDTNFLEADVYAVLYLSFEGGPWNEYAETVDFTLYGSSESDAYVLETELMSGYLTGSYDLLIEVFDAYDDTFLVSFGPEDTSELAYLPLEDYNRDAPPNDIIVVHDHGGGGAMDRYFVSALLLLLIFSTVRKIWLHRKDEVVRIDS